MTHATRPHPITGALLVLLSAIGFSSKAIIAKLAYLQGVDAASLIALRMLCAIPFFVGLGWWAMRQATPMSMQAKDWGLLVLLAVVGGYGSMWLNFEGLKTISAGLERVILFIYPTLVVGISAVWLQHRITRREWVAMLASYAGVVLVVWHDVSWAGWRSDHTLLGATWVFLSALMYAGYLLVSGYLIPKLGASRFTAFSMSLIALTSLWPLIGQHEIQVIRQLPEAVYGLALLMALVATVLPSVCMNLGIQQLGSRKVALMSAIGPVSTIVLAMLFLNEPISWLQGFGTGLVLAGVLAVSVEAKTSG